MTVVFDLDNTIVDQFGSTVRPGIVDVIFRLRKKDVRIVLWTNSTRQRAREIIELHGLRTLFDQVIFREDYDPAEQDLRKDIRRVKGDLIVDDDPEEVRSARSVGRGGFLIKPYRKGDRRDPREIAALTRYLERVRNRWWLPRFAR